MNNISIKIDFNTLNVPAPFAHNYTLKVDIGQKIEATYEVRYLDRSSVTLDEILDEGFSENDDFKVTGEIANNWKPYVLNLSKPNTSITSKEETEFTQTRFKILYQENGIDKEYTCYDDDKLSYDVHEIIQALLESAKRELPLEIHLMTILKGKKTNHNVHISFANRTFSISDENNDIKTLDWQSGRDFMNLIYSPSYSNEPDKPKKDGLYISFEKEYWFYAAELENEESIKDFTKNLQSYLS